MTQLKSIASEQSLGKSKNEILNTVYAVAKKNLLKRALAEEALIVDVGCGTGDLLNLLKSLDNVKLFACDYSDFDSQHLGIEFKRHDCNEKLPWEDNKFDVTLSSEVIEHIENPRFFMRELTRITKPGSSIIVSTPNIHSLTSRLTFLAKGYHSDFGPKSYPAHISALSPTDLVNIVSEIVELKLSEVCFTNSGRIIGTAIKWQKILPALRGKLFSDNFVVAATKI